MDDLILEELVARAALLDALDAYEDGEIDSNTYLAILDWVMAAAAAAAAAEDDDERGSPSIPGE